MCLLTMFFFTFCFQRIIMKIVLDSYCKFVSRRKRVKVENVLHLFWKVMAANVVILVVFWCIYWLIFTPILCYFTYQFWQLRYTQIVRKRFYHLSIFLAIASIFGTTIYSPYYLLRIYYISINKTFIAMDIIYVPMFAICIFGVTALLALRFWCLWYYVKWTS